MNQSNEIPLPKIQSAIFGELKKNWGWLLAFGILSIVLGTIGLGMTFGLTLASVLLFGVLLIIGGVVQIFDAFKCKGWKSTLWHVLIALLYIGAGAMMVADPILASATLTLFLAAILLAVGVMRIFMAFQMRPAKGWGWLLAGGIVTILLGGMIISGWPMSGLWVIGLFVAVELIVNGWTSVFVALAARSAAKEEHQAPATGSATLGA
jgi:uncharacterized membrane protein HdeD (DUF308 family)